MRRQLQRGGAILETAMFAPFLLLLLVAMIEMARVGYTYYTLQKMMFTLARYIGTQQGVNFCDEADTTLTQAKNYAVTGTLDASADPIVAGMTADRLRVRVERWDLQSETLSECECSAEGCDLANGGSAPNFVVVDITDGFSVRPLFFGFSVDSMLLRPRVRVPYGGT